MMATDYAAMATGAASGFLNAFYYAMIVALVLGIVFLIIYKLSFKVKVTLRYKTSGPYQILDKKGKYVTDKEGLEKLLVWMNLFKRKTFKMPPPYAISLTKKGKHYLDIEMSEDGRCRYLGVKEELKNANSKSGGFQPFDSNDRVFQIHEAEKRILRKKKTLGELIMALAPLLALIIIFVAFLAFFGDVVKPVQDAADRITAHEAQMKTKDIEILQLMKEIKLDVQVIREEKPVKKVESTTQTTPPPDQKPPE